MPPMPCHAMPCHPTCAMPCHLCLVCDLCHLCHRCQLYQHLDIDHDNIILKLPIMLIPICRDKNMPRDQLAQPSVCQWQPCHAIPCYLCRLFHYATSAAGRIRATGGKFGNFVVRKITENSSGLGCGYYGNSGSSNWEIKEIGKVVEFLEIKEIWKITEI